MQNFIVRTDQIRALFYVSGSLNSSKMGELLFIDLKIQDMICQVEIYQYIATKYRVNEQAAPVA